MINVLSKIGILDGRKTALGLVLFVGGMMIAAIGFPEAGEAISDIGISLTGIGALHKLWKGK